MLIGLVFFLNELIFYLMNVDINCILYYRIMVVYFYFLIWKKKFDVLKFEE